MSIHVPQFVDCYPVRIALPQKPNRLEYIAIKTVNHVLPLICRRRLNDEDLAMLCESASTLETSRDAVYRVANSANHRADRIAFQAGISAAALTYAEPAAVCHVYTDVLDKPDKLEVYTIACGSLDGGILLSNPR